MQLSIAYGVSVSVSEFPGTSGSSARNIRQQSHLIRDGDCVYALLLRIPRAAHRRLRVDDTAGGAPLKVVLLSPPDTRQQVPERDAQLQVDDWSRAPCLPSWQRPPLTPLEMAVLGAQHAPEARTAFAYGTLALTRATPLRAAASDLFIVQPALEAW